MTNQIIVRNYNPKTDYSDIYHLYTTNNTFGWQYDAARDTEQRLLILHQNNPNKILVALIDNQIVWTVTLFKDERSAWLYRFAIQQENEYEIAQKLFWKAKEICKQLWHTQVLVYWPANDTHFEQRYTSLAFHKWNDFTAYWQNI